MTGAKSGGMDAMAMINPGAAAIDIGSTMHMAAVNPRADDNPVRAFGTFTGDLHEVGALVQSMPRHERGDGIHRCILDPGF